MFFCIKQATSQIKLYLLNKNMQVFIRENLCMFVVICDTYMICLGIKLLSKHERRRIKSVKDCIKLTYQHHRLNLRLELLDSQSFYNLSKQ
jgi:hypothetical protein